MVDFVKRFRRTKSIVKNDNEFPTENEPQQTFIEKVKAKKTLSADDLDSSDSSEVFKEQKGWRKSFRKLRWKRKESEHRNNIDEESRDHFTFEQTEHSFNSKTKLNKRWSYSPGGNPDHYEGGNPVSRNNSKKLTGSLNDHSNAGDNDTVQKYGRNAKSASLLDDDDFTSLFKDKRLTFQNDGSICFKDEFFRSYDKLASTTSPAKSQQKQTASADNILLATQVNPEAICSLVASSSYQFLDDSEDEQEHEPDQLEDIEDALDEMNLRSGTSSFSQSYTGDQRSMTLRSISDSLMRVRNGSGYEHDAEFVLENMKLPTTTTNYQQGDGEGNPQSPSPIGEESIDSSATSGEAENNVKENEDEIPEEEAPINSTATEENHVITVEGQESVMCDDDFPPPPPDLPLLNEQHCHQAEGADNEMQGEYAASWGTSEWDDSSDDVTDDDDIDDKMKPTRGKLSVSSDTSKQNRVSRNLQSFKFWDRSSTKKKFQESPPEAHSFIALHHSRTLKNLSRAELPPEPADLTEKQRKRRYIIMSIIETENSYLDSLMRLENDYKQGLLDGKPQIITSDIVEKMFFKVSEILQCHQLFQIALASALQHWDESECVGETFVASFSKSMVLECYGGYINNFSIAMELVRKTCVRKPQFLEFLRQRQAEASSRVNLFGLMLKPVQRFPQFILLIQDLLKYTPHDHPDRLQLQLALTELEILTERLNQRKADDENRADLKLLLDNSNLKLSPPVKHSLVRRLLKQGEIQECEHNDDGLLEKMKVCSLVLTTDMLICCSINTRRTVALQRANTTDVTYKLKWRVNLEDLQVYDGVSNYQEHINRETLHSDFIVLQRISKLAERLQLPHEGVNPAIFDKCLVDLEKKIRQAEQTTRQPEHFSLTVKFPWKSGFTNRTLIFSYVSQKDDWLEHIKNAKLAHAPSNVNSWFVSDTAEGDSTWKSPLFVRAVSAHLTYETLQVECGHAFMQSPQVTLLWLSCTSGSCHSLVSVYYVTEERVEKVHVMQVESCVRCIEHWNPNGSGDSVWLGLESGCLLEYSATRGSYRAMSEVTMPTESSVMLIKSHKNLLFVGLLEGKLLMYRRNTDQVAEVDMIASIVVGGEPLTKLFHIEDQLWAFSGNNVVTVDIQSFQIQNCRPIPIDEEEAPPCEECTQVQKRKVKLVTRVGSGLWVAFDQECTLNLYYLGTLSRLQEVNLSRIIRDFVQELGENEIPGLDSEPYHITSLENGNSQLYVGTSNGLLLVMPLPKLPDSVPKITGPCKVSRYSLNGPVHFLFAPTLSPPYIPPHTPTTTTNHYDVTDDQRDPSLPPPIPKRDDEEDHRQKNGGEQPPTTTVLRHPNHLPVKHRRNPPNPIRRSCVTSRISNIDEELLEDDAIYDKREIDSIVSPQKLAFIDWEEAMKSSRQCSMVLASGRGYRRCLPSTTEEEGGKRTDEQPSILCWKIVL